MKVTLVIETDDRTNFSKILDNFRMIKGVKKVESVEEVCEEIAPPFPMMAREELDRRIQKSIDGPNATSEMVEKFFSEWENEE